MLQNTRGIVLRTIKYGDTSVICSIFTELYGVQSYHVKGVRSVKAKQQKAGLLQPATLLELVVYNKQQNLQHIREFQPAYIYETLQSEIIKNSVALFSVELLLRLLPDRAPAPELFQFAYDYFCALDKTPVDEVANFPVYFTIQCSKLLGYNVMGSYSEQTPYLHATEGAFLSYPPSEKSLITKEDARLMNILFSAGKIDEVIKISLNAACRNRLLDWQLEFLHHHSQHLGSIKSLDVLRVILH